MTYIEKLCNEFFDNSFSHLRKDQQYRPDWMKNPSTGRNLELDIFYHQINLAIEVDGITHEICEDQKIRDKIKDKLCDDYGVELLRIKHPKELLQLSQEFKSLYNIKEVSPELRRKMMSYRPGRKGKFVRAIKHKNKLADFRAKQQKLLDNLK